jgi:hypothetical protein
MGVITGIGAAISGLSCLEQFRITTSGVDNAVACSGSGGGVVRGDTNYDWEGVAVGYGHTPPKMPGALFTFTGSDRAGQGWQSAANGAIVDKVRIFCNPLEAELFYYHLYFKANGSLTPGAYSATSGTAPAGISSKERAIVIDGNPVMGSNYWNLEIDGNLPEPLWTPSSGGWPVRAPTDYTALGTASPGNIDATIVWRQHYNTMSDLVVIGAANEYHLYVTASLYWSIKWARVLEIPTQYVIRNKGNRPDWVGAQCKAQFSGYESSTKGHIMYPAGTYYWGSA